MVIDRPWSRVSVKFRYNLRTRLRSCQCLSDQLRAYVFGDLFKVDDQLEFELDGLSPEGITATQRACEFRVRGL